jgi:hypothetical protein
MLSLAYRLTEGLQMILKLKVSLVEFNAAESNGAVYGQLRKGIYVYAELGQEKDYIERFRDDPKTRYRLFINCDAFFAETKAQIADGDYATSISGVTIIIFN